MNASLDCMVVGAGPAGLTAAIYLARFHLRLALVDAGQSRTALIPRSRNVPGHPGGVVGTDLLARMRAQAADHDVAVVSSRVTRIDRDPQGFAVHGEDRSWLARSVLIATGVVNRRPPIATELHEVALAGGLLRYCPICDGYEATDRRIGVIGTGSHGASKALFLRSFSPAVTLIAPAGPHALDEADRASLVRAGVRLLPGPCGPLRIESATIVAPCPQGELVFDTIYPALGSVIRSELAVALGAEAGADGCIRVDRHQRTTVPGLYAAGDVTMGLDQISRAMGEAALAATTIRNDLDARQPLRRG